ncbi:hypothetical protein GV054_09145 [Marinomonas mediterranea]|uniref:Gp37 protein n=1 Tax=Marinomonas mediterranea (strain ATCC 700492 / JCM 21426 / NBRC 103028 / MMB-1) TaxID=717774 RepID=F2K221_MARM1|nr:hypothetical protein [Marinomonas mediterranea]ADZ91099.1 hypothetical protein Marme_1843 [Marinomonas mediterranea MMB-1]WCN13160.1 hypothetical protein GV054_09145 [Marinomonas mediterranea]WCN17231.1 hypothetical protein GV053_09305 [Marinomonas mediterranea MMB-1]
MKSILEYFDALKAGLNTSASNKGVQIPLVEFATSIESWDALPEMAILIDFPELNEATGHSASGTNQEKVGVYLHCILSNRVEVSELKVINLASFVKRLLVRNRWGLSDIGIPENIVAYPSDFKRGDKGFNCWTVEFSQVVEMDESLLEEDRALKSIFLGINPKHDSDFSLIATNENPPK